jgi:hypothetical protein
MLADSSDPFLLKVIPVFKKLAGANKQLIVISKSASRTVEARPKKDEASARAYTLNNQLVLAQENLNKANEDFLERLRETARDQSPASLVELLNMAAAVASSTSFLVNCCKAVTIELAGRDLFKQVLQATRTVRDALTLAIDSIKDGIPPPQLIAHLPEAEKKLQAAVTTVKQSTMQLVTAQATIVGDNFVSAARKQEILGASPDGFSLLGIPHTTTRHDHTTRHDTHLRSLHRSGTSGCGSIDKTVVAARVR